jgi:predicted permease
MFICKYKVKRHRKVVAAGGWGGGGGGGFFYFFLSCSGGWKPVDNTCIIAFCISFQSACFLGCPFFLFSIIFFGMGKKIS